MGDGSTEDKYRQMEAVTDRRDVIHLCLAELLNDSACLKGINAGPLVLARSDPRYQRAIDVVLGIRDGRLRHATPQLCHDHVALSPALDPILVGREPYPDRLQAIRRTEVCRYRAARVNTVVFVSIELGPH